MTWGNSADGVVGAGPRRRFNRTNRVPRWLALSIVVATVAGIFVGIISPAQAGVGFGVSPQLTTPSTVGAMGLDGVLDIQNTSSNPDNVDEIELTSITLVPACGGDATAQGDCPAAFADPGVFQLSPTATGEGACAGTNFTVTVVDASTGKVSFNPQGGPVVLQPPGDPGDTCRIRFTFDTLKAPTIDAVPGTAGVQTFQLGNAQGFNRVTMLNSGFVNGRGQATVLAAASSIVTSATPTTPLGQPITDNATVTGVAGGPTPTGDVTFTVYGPDDAACAGPVVFTSANRPLTAVAPPTNPPSAEADSAPFVPTLPGTYRWVARYNGSNDYDPVTSLCNAANESSLVTGATVTTQATPQATVGDDIIDTATVTGVTNGPVPTGTVTFTTYGPDDVNCAGPIVFFDANRPLSPAAPPTVPPSATAVSLPFTPVAPGAYRWIAAYNGDAVYPAVTSDCNDAGETSLVLRPVATITTQATPNVTVGSPIQDVATVTGGAAPAPTPTGTVTFTLYGPDDALCAGPVVFTSANRPLGGPPPPTATSLAFTPTLPGSYQWIARYNGDAAYDPVVSGCGDAGETSVVAPAVATIATQATPRAQLGQPINDTAIVTGDAAPAPAPTGTVTFTVYGPDDALCAGPVVFTSATRPLTAVAPPTVPPTATATSADFTPTLPGSYRWIATYNGSANYDPVTSACGDANETSVVVDASITTQATPTATVGSPITDTATVTGTTGAPAPTGTVTFTAYGPDDLNCATVVFTSANRPLTASAGPPPPRSTAFSAPFMPTVAGTYRWIASYSGDAVYGPETSLCNDANETTVVTRAVANITTVATPTATLGSPIQDVATVTGAPAPAPVPTGTVTFTLFGPDNLTCAGQPIFTSANRPLGGGPPPIATSAPFTPTAIGTYRWIARYNGDGAYPPVTSLCNDANEQSVVTRPVARVTTTATPAATIGSPIQDVATVTGPAAPAPVPTGTVTFTLFGPDNLTCAGQPIFTSATRPLGGGPPPTATSAPFTPTATGSYRWIAAYNGDAVYAPVASACNDANETSLIGPSTATIVTSATPSVTIGRSIVDQATVTGGPAPAPAPTGTVTFTLFGPDNLTCAGQPIFTSANRPLGGGPPPTATSAPFTPTAVGSYRWIARYNGDGAYPAVTSSCNDANETSVVTRSAATIVTNATPAVTVGAPISDTATVTGGPAPAPVPTGTVTFTLFGPDNATCTGPPIFTSANRPLGGGPPPTATSATFTPTAPGSYRWIARYNGDAAYPAVVSLCNDANETSLVNRPIATVVTQALSPVNVGNPITDRAIVTGGPAPAPAPTGTVTFNLYGPTDTTCTQPPIFTSANRPLGGGPPPTATSAPFTPTTAGSYRWIARYNGDAVYAPVISACNDANETSVVVQVPVAIATIATPTANVGGTMTDTATVTGGAAPAPAPTGTVTFTLYGPTDTTCTQPAIFTSADRPLGGGPPPTATSAPFTPTAVGTYRWIARYSGDATYPAVTSACNDANENTVVTQAAATIVTQATPTATVGSPISDTATVTGTAGAPAPTGTVTFTLFGPNNADCSGTPIFTSADRPLGGGPPPTATSAAFTTTAPGAYRWIARYNGDATYLPVTSACNDANETSQVNQASASIVTQAVGPVTLGRPISDRATVTGSPASAPVPTGTVTFTLFGPNNAACTGAPIFTSANRPLGGGPPPTALSEEFTPTAAGTYNWVAVYNGDGNYPSVTSPCGAPNEASIVTSSPTIMVDKTVTPATLPEPGGDFNYTVVVTNTSNEVLTIRSLTDDKYGDLTTRANSTCNTAIGTVLPVGGTYTCRFTAPFMGRAGATLTDIVTVRGTNPSGVEVTDSDDAVVGITGVAPAIAVVKTATPLTRPEPGGTFTFDVVVTNTGPEIVTITALTDNVYGNLNGRGTCAIGAVLPANGGTYRCSFPGDFFGNAGASQTDIVTVTGVDDDGDRVTASDDAVVRLTPVSPAIAVVKTANPLSRPEPGGTFTFDVLVTNTGPEVITITSLTDNIYGNLNGRGTCATGAVLPANGGTYRCSFPGDFFGNAGASQTDIVSVTGVDDDGERVTANDDAVVTLTNVPPTVTLIKDADPISRPEPGGQFTFLITVTNTSNEPVTITSLTDDVYGNLNGRGTCAIGAVLPANGGTYRCSFTAEYRGPAGSSQVDRVTVIVVDNDNTSATATDDARISITPVGSPPVTAPPPPPPLPRTGSDVGGPAQLAMFLLFVGMLMVAATWRSMGPGLTLAPVAGRGPRVARLSGPPPGGRDGRRLFGRTGPAATTAPGTVIDWAVDDLPSRPPDVATGFDDDDDPDDDPPPGGPGRGGSRPPGPRPPAAGPGSIVPASARDTGRSQASERVTRLI